PPVPRDDADQPPVDGRDARRPGQGLHCARRGPGGGVAVVDTGRGAAARVQGPRGHLVRGGERGLARRADGLARRLRAVPGLLADGDQRGVQRRKPVGGDAGAAPRGAARRAAAGPAGQRVRPVRAQDPRGGQQQGEHDGRRRVAGRVRAGGAGRGAARGADARRGARVRRAGVQQHGERVGAADRRDPAGRHRHVPQRQLPRPQGHDPPALQRGRRPAGSRRRRRRVGRHQEEDQGARAGPREQARQGRELQAQRHEERRVSRLARHAAQLGRLGPRAAV
ncbi:hypothetical protein KEM52_002285, partial [Ascosphaera acerosa]